MTLPYFRYQYDPTGVNPDNRVEGEVRTMTPRQVRAVVPMHGPFFSESLIIYDDITNRLLVKGTDYQVTSFYQELSMKVGRSISQVILITNVDVSERIRVTYQSVGGLYQNYAQAIADMYDSLLNDTRPVDWSNVEGKPFEYNPTLHKHLLQDIVGFEPLVTAIEKISSALVLNNIPAFEAMIEWVESKVGDLGDQLEAHINDKDNPHETTAEQLGAYTKAEVDKKFDDMPRSTTLILQRPWTQDVLTLYRYIEKEITVFSTNFTGVLRTTGNGFARLPVKEFVVKHPDDSREVFPAREANATSELPGTSSTYFPIDSQTPGSPTIPTRSYDLGKLKFLIDEDGVSTYRVDIRAKDYFGNESLGFGALFTIQEPFDANLTNFSTTIPSLVSNEDNTYSVRLGGATSNTGGAVTYNILSISSPNVTFNKTSDIANNENLQMTVAETSDEQIDVEIVVAITNGINCYSRVTVEFTIVKEIEFELIGKSVLLKEIHASGIWKIIGVAGGGNGNADHAGGGGGAFASEVELEVGDSIALTAGGIAEATTVRINPGPSETLFTANPGTSATNLESGTGADASGADHLFSGTDGVSGHWTDEDETEYVPSVGGLSGRGTETEGFTNSYGNGGNSDETSGQVGAIKLKYIRRR